MASLPLFHARSELPHGLVYQPGFLGEAEERALLSAIATLDLVEAEYKQFTAKRRVASFGADYDFTHNTLEPAPPLPDFLQPIRDRAAGWAGLPAREFAHGLVTEYRPGTQLGWHRDSPQFGVVVGISLGTACRMRFRPYPPKKGAQTFELVLEPRSAYVLRDEVRWGWQHSIPPTPALRYSITFRTLAAVRPGRRAR